jgi:hypothetical protein
MRAYRRYVRIRSLYPVISLQLKWESAGIVRKKRRMQPSLPARGIPASSTRMGRSSNRSPMIPDASTSRNGSAVPTAMWHPGESIIGIATRNTAPGAEVN